MGPFGVLLLGTVAGVVVRPYLDRAVADAVKRANAQAAEDNKSRPKA